MHVKRLIKDKTTGRVDIPWRIYAKRAKNIKMKSQDRKKT